MSERPDTTDYRALFLSPTPMMDMRAPAEFTRGAFPSALSLPLMSDDERAQVGICYKQQGQDAAIALGHALVSGDLKAQRWHNGRPLHNNTPRATSTAFAEACVRKLCSGGCARKASITP